MLSCPARDEKGNREREEAEIQETRTKNDVKEVVAAVIVTFCGI